MELKGNGIDRCSSSKIVHPAVVNRLIGNRLIRQKRSMCLARYDEHPSPSCACGCHTFLVNFIGWQPHPLGMGMVFYMAKHVRGGLNCHKARVRQVSYISCVLPGIATGRTGRSPSSYFSGDRSSLDLMAQSHFKARPV